MRTALTLGRIYLSVISLLVQIWTAPRLAETSVLSSCSFDTSDWEMECSWTTPNWTDGSWVFSRGSTNSRTGPQWADTDNGNQGFVVLNSSSFKDSQGVVQSGKNVTLLTSVLSGVKCMAFLFMKYGDAAIGELRIGISENGTARDRLLWHKSGTTAPDWQCQTINLTTQNQWVFVEASSGQNELGDVAVDEIKFFSDSCPLQESACKSFLTESFVPVTSSFTEVSSTQTSFTKLTSVSSSQSSSKNTPTMPKSSGNGTDKSDSVDTIIMLSTIIPLVVLIIAGVTAYVCYRRRLLKIQKKAQESPYDAIRQRSLSLGYDVFQREQEQYDVIPDDAVK